jgi:hypothetical protein
MANFLKAVVKITLGGFLVFAKNQSLIFVAFEYPKRSDLLNIGE